jgi:hypothetical protein
VEAASVGKSGPVGDGAATWAASEGGGSQARLREQRAQRK